MSRTSRPRRLTAGLAAAALALTTLGAATAHAVPSSDSSAAATPGPLMNYVVNTKATPGHVRKVEEAVKARRRHGAQLVHAAGRGGRAVDQRRTSAPPSAPGTTDVRCSPSAPPGPPRSAKAQPAPVRRPPAGLKAVDETQATPVLDPREGEQWDMVQIKADQAHQITDGSRQVLVGINDSGVDDTHPDLAPNFDAQDSVNCVNNGVPNTTPGAWRPTTSSHGTHVAGTVAAARNGVGIVGVAPGRADRVGQGRSTTTASSTRSTRSAGSSGPPSTTWTSPTTATSSTRGSSGARTTATRARCRKRSGARTRGPTGRGDLSVAAAGNSNYDLANKTTDNGSPNDTTPVPRHDQQQLPGHADRAARRDHRRQHRPRPAPAAASPTSASTRSTSPHPAARSCPRCPAAGRA